MSGGSEDDERTSARPVWLERFVEPSPIRREGAFHLYRARDASSRAPRIVIVTAPEVDSARAKITLDRVARAHELLDHPRIPRLAERGSVGEVEFVSLLSNAVTDFDTLWTAHALHSGAKVDYSTLLGVGVEIIDAIISAHKVDVDGKPLALGIFSPASILLSEDGRAQLLGFGAFTQMANEDGHPVSAANVFVAPEVAAGGAPSPAGDVYAYLTMIRSLLPYVNSPPPMERVLMGQPRPEDMELAEVLGTAQMKALAPVATMRFSSMAEFAQAYERSWHLAGIQADPSGFRRWATDLLPRLKTTHTTSTTRASAPWASVASTEELIAIHAGRYRIERKLGRGGSGNVFLAWDRELKQRVALKLIKPERRAELQDRFLREVRILREVRHPHLVRGYDLLFDDENLGAILEYVPGMPLDEHLDANPDDIARLPLALADVADALSALHARGIVHRDVKPSNLVWKKEHGPVLVDFGVAAETHGERPLTKTGEMVGTPLYMAPEQLRGDRTGPSCDVFGLALVLVEAIGRAHPFPSSDVQRALELRLGEIPAIDTIPSEIQDIVRLALDKVPERRPTAADFARALRGERRKTSYVKPKGEARLRIARDGRHYTLDGSAPVELRRRKSLRLILMALVEAHIEKPGSALDLDALQAAGWPGENLLAEAGANRTYVTLSNLRKMGFKDVLISRDDGYLLDPEFTVALID